MTNILEVRNYQLPAERVTDYICFWHKVTLGFKNQITEAKRWIAIAWATFDAHKQTLHVKYPYTSKTKSSHRVSCPFASAVRKI